MWYDYAMKKILLIQSRMSATMIALEQEEYTEAINNRAELVCISSLDETLPWDEPAEMLKGINGVLIGGSGDFDFDGGRAPDDAACVTSQEIAARLRPLILYILENDVPLFGVCYGHQIVSEVLGVKVLHDKTQTKVGTFPVSLTEAGKQDALFSDMPETFMAQYGHKDSATDIPRGATLLASSPQCNASAFRYGSHVYTTQFHPESTGEGMGKKLSNSPGYLPEGVSVELIIKPSFEASTLIPKFLDRIVGTG